MRACGVRVVFLAHGALGICMSSACTCFWASVRFIHIVLFYSFFASERRERKPPAERSALYRLTFVFLLIVFFYYLLARLFHYVYLPVCFRRDVIPLFFAFVGLFVGTMYEHVVVERLLLYCSTTSTQHSTAQSAGTKPKQGRADQSATTQASRQSWQEPAHAVEHLYSTLSSQNERRNRHPPGLRTYATTHTALV